MKKSEKNKKKGFTLIELLAVIVILGLLIAIAIPSVTRYITQSRKKTLTATIGNYISAVVNEVNDLRYTFTKSNTIYAVPVECVALERGGTNPFGKWHQASDDYWAYVLVQYDDLNSSYTYGFTFKDSAGYGLYPIAQNKINTNGKQIQTRLELSRPVNGKVTTTADVDKWKSSGFAADNTTNLVVLVAESEGETGNGKTTCTLAQKGTNYDTIESEKSQNEKNLANNIIKNNTVKTGANLGQTTVSSNEIGLYVSNDTNDGRETYFFRGNVDNNYVSFAGLTWRIVRINEDGTIRIILDDGIYGNTGYLFTSARNDSTSYYSNSDIVKPSVEGWYSSVLANYDSYIADGTFCEQAKVGFGENDFVLNQGLIYYPNYTSSFRCTSDANYKGILTAKVGLISYDEVVHAGGNIWQANDSIYLRKDMGSWVMGVNANNYGFSYVGYLNNQGGIWGNNGTDSSTYAIRPVINLKADTLATGSGLAGDMYVVETK